MVSEEDVLENTSYLKSLAARPGSGLPVRYVQVDDGYQEGIGDWLESNEKFPHGIAWLARQTRAAGFIPGIWVAPFAVAESSELVGGGELTRAWQTTRDGVISRLKIAWIGKLAPIDGNVTYSNQITKELQARGHEVAFFHFGPETAPFAHETVRLPIFARNQAMGFASPGARAKLHHSLSALSPDVMHASLGLSSIDFAFPKVCRQLGIPTVATFHLQFNRNRNLWSTAYGIAYRVYARNLAKYDRVIIFSETQKELLSAYGVDPKRVVVLPNGVDTRTYSPGPSDFKNSVGAEQIVTYIGRIDGEKQVETLIQAFLSLRLDPRTKLVIAGNGTLFRPLKARYGRQPQILFLGYVSDLETKLALLRATDVWVLPSLAEGLSLALLEAMACGVPIVATDAGADGEALGDAGIVISTRRVKRDLTPALETLLRSSESERRTLGQKARERAVRLFSLENNVARLEETYREIT